MFVFQSLAEVREQTEKWLKEYNEERPHESLGHLTPREYLLTQKPGISSYKCSREGGCCDAEIIRMVKIVSQLSLK
jgi:hypothetical protein